MSELEIDFEWPVAAKYELQPATAEEIRKRRDGAPPEISEAELSLYLGSIVPSGKTEVHRPTSEKLERAVKVLVGGIDSKKTPFHTVALTVSRALGKLMPGASDPLPAWCHLAELLREMFEEKDFTTARGKEAAERIGLLGIFLTPGKDNRPVLALRPVGLYNALILCAARMIATGTTFNICEHCKTPFLSGGSRGRSKKRSDARFCSSACRWKFHNELRRKAR